MDEKIDLSGVPDDALFMNFLFTALANHSKEHLENKEKYLSILKKELIKRGIFPDHNDE